MRRNVTLGSPGVVELLLLAGGNPGEPRSEGSELKRSDGSELYKGAVDAVASDALLLDLHASFDFLTSFWLDFLAGVSSLSFLPLLPLLLLLHGDASTAVLPKSTELSL